MWHHFCVLYHFCMLDHLSMLNHFRVLNHSCLSFRCREMLDIVIRLHLSISLNFSMRLHFDELFHDGHRLHNLDFFHDSHFTRFRDRTLSYDITLFRHFHHGCFRLHSRYGLQRDNRLHRYRRLHCRDRLHDGNVFRCRHFFHNRLSFRDNLRFVYGNGLSFGLLLHDRNIFNRCNRAHMCF